MTPTSAIATVRARTPKLAAYAWLTASLLLAALALRRPEPVALAVPFASMLLVGLALAGDPAVDVRAALDRARVVEGDRVTLTVTVTAATRVDRLELHCTFPTRLTSPGGDPAQVRVVALPAGGHCEVPITVGCDRWGAYQLGEIHLRAHDRFGLLTWTGRVTPQLGLRVVPGPEPLRALIRPLETQARAGNQTARRAGRGVEFAELRPYTPGDQVREVNWRVTARRGELMINQRHPDRNADVVLFLDAFTAAGDQYASTLDLAVRAAATLARRYLASRDRVGLVGFGGYLHWIRPGIGLVQGYRIVDQLLQAQIVASVADKDLDVLPVRSLPPSALVVALTPLLDPRGIGALADLSARGYDVAVIEVAPEQFLPPASSDTDRLAARLWALDRELIRERLRRLGIAVGTWQPGQPLDLPMEEVRRFRRHARP